MIIKRISILAIILLLFVTIPVFEAKAAENVWELKAPMHQARGALGVIAVGEKIYAIGGAVNNVYNTASDSWRIVGTNEEYNPQTNSWTTKMSMPTPRAYFSLSTYHNKIYCFGGINGEGMLSYQDTDIQLPGILWSNATEVYNPLTDSWEKKTSMPANMQGRYSIVVINELMYFIGGIGTQPAAIYNPNTDTWNTTLSSNPEVTKSWNTAVIEAYVQTGLDKGDGQFAAAAIDDTVYVVSSSTHTPGNEALFIYNTSNESWKLGALAPASVSSSVAVVISGIMAPTRIYLEAQSANYIYNPFNESWQVGTPIESSRFDFGVTILGDKLYVIGGYSSENLVSGVAKNEEYTPVGYRPLPQSTPTHVGSPEESFSYSVLFAFFGVSVAILIAGIAIYLRRFRGQQGSD